MFARIARLSLTAFALAFAGCAAPIESDEAVATDSSELRQLQADEILGEIRYGQTVEVPYSGTPRYRAYWFTGVKNEWLKVDVKSSTGDVWAFVVDEQYRTVRRGTAGVLPRTGKYFIAVREGELRDATITIKFDKHALPATPAPAPSAPTAE